MRILLLSQWCPPEPEFRVLNLGAALVERGHDVTLITGFPNYPQGKIYPGYKQKLFQRENKLGVKLIRLPLYPDHSRSTIRRMLTYFSFALSVFILGPFFAGHPQVIWVYHPPLTIGIPAVWLSFLKRVPFVYEIQDMWPETVVASGMLKQGMPIRLLHALAHFVYNQATAITVISKGFKENLITKGVPEKKITIIPNWGDESVYRPQERDPELGYLQGLTGHFNVMFAGTMGPAQGLETVIEAAEKLQDLTDLQFVMIGDGISLPDLKATVETKKLTNIRFIDRQPASAMSQFFAWGDVMLVQLRDDPLFHMTIPSKTLAYLASACFIVCAVPGDGADLVREAGAGLISPPDNPQALAETLRQAYALSPSERKAMGRAGLQMFQAHFTRAELVSDYETVFKQVAQEE